MYQPTNINDTFLFCEGFEKPSAIQQRAVKPILSGRDVIAQSQSGTGKTSMFCLSILQLIDTERNEPQALILNPTRELALQTQKACYFLELFVFKLRGTFGKFLAVEKIKNIN